MKTRNCASNTEKVILLNTARLLAEASHQAVCITDPDNYLTYVNPAFERLYECSLAEVQGRTPQFLLDPTYEPDTPKRVMDSTRQAGYWHGVLPNISRTGTRLQVNLHTRTISDHRDRVLAMLAFAAPVPMEPANLSPKQKEIYRLLGQGLIPKEIADRLGCQRTTISEQIHRMVKKVPGVRDARDLQCHAVRTLATQHAQ